MMSGQQEFSDRTVVVTGCSSGIGLAASRTLQQKGAHVIGLDLNPPPIELEYCRLDLSDSSAIVRASGEISGPVHGLVNAAGVSSGLGDPLKVIGINFVGLRELTELLVPKMPPDSYIACTSSLAAADYRNHIPALSELLATTDRESALAWCREHPEELGAGYSLSKEAVIHYAAINAVALAARGIRINCTAPGVTETPIIASSVASLGQQYLDAIPKPLGRLATAQEQADVLVFLVSRNASYISGQTIWVDGGYSAGVESGQIQPFALKR